MNYLFLQVPDQATNLIWFINNHHFLGIPLDIISHLLVGLIMTYLGLKIKLPFWKIMAFLFALEFGKELVDSYAYNSPMLEHFKDFFFTFLYPGLYFIRQQVDQNLFKFWRLANHR